METRVVREVVWRTSRALGVACAVAFVVGVVDSFHGFALGVVPWLRLTAATVSWALLPASLGALCALLLASRVRWGRGVARLIDPSDDPVARLAGWLVVLCFSLFGFFFVHFFADRFGSPVTPALATAFAVPCCVVLGRMMVRVATRDAAPWRRFIEARDDSQRRVLLGLVVVAWGAALVGVALEYLRTLAPWGWLMVVACMIVPVCLAERSGRARYARWGLYALGACAWPLLVWNLTTGLPPPLEVQIAEHTWMAQRLSSAFEPLTFARRASAPSGGGAATCAPKEPLPHESDVGRAPSDAPDIVLITVDALRWDRTSWASASGHTPKLLARSANAAVFERAYTSAPSTRQGMRALFSGLHNGVVKAPPSTRWGLSFAEGQPTLASYLRAAGYATVAVNTKPEVFSAPHRALHGFDTQERLPYQKKRPYGAAKVVDRLLHHLTRPSKGPRFIWTHFMEPHWPYESGPPGSPQAKSLEARQRQAISYVDKELNRFLDNALGEHRRDNTIVVLTADHGEGFGEHNNKAHGTTVYEEEVRVPLVVWGPGVKGRRHRTPVSLVNVLPTLLELSGLRSPPGLCGQSLASAIRGEGEVLAQPVYVAALPDETFKAFKVGFIDGHDKLILDGRSGAVELYDLQADPKERNNLEKRDPARLAKLHEGFATWLKARGMDTKILEPLSRATNADAARAEP